MIYPHLTCPKHKFAYVSMPRLEDERLMDSGRYIAKCPLKYCFHGLPRPVIGGGEEFDTGGNAAPPNNGA